MLSVSISPRLFSIGFNSDFCAYCGAKAIHKCPSCDAEIRGVLVLDDMVRGTMDSRDTPSFCHKCGESYPWTKASIEAAQELADEIDLTDEEKESFRKSVVEVTTENPRTVLATSKLKRFLSKAGNEVKEAAKEILVRVIVESAQKGIWG